MTDRATVALARANSRATEISFIAGRRRLDHGLGQALDHLHSLGFHTSERAVDLALFTAAMTAADTRISRTTESQDRWTREIDLHVPVAEPHIWASLAPLLVQMLEFLTGDRWGVYFRPRPAGLDQLAPPPRRRRVIDPSCVCLFSGGLDSFIGAVDLISRGEKPLLISHYWDGGSSPYQTLCCEHLKKHFTTVPLNHIRTRVGFASDIVGESRPENTLRGRSFLFFALAALAASGFERDVVIHVPENGFISLNVPLDPLRLGSNSTRTTHPFYMARWNELLAALGVPARLENGYRHHTKGQMVQECADRAFLRRYAKDTMSCSSPTKLRWAGEKPMHCGYCVPCVIRRAALLAGFGTDDTAYGIPNLQTRPLDSSKAEGRDVRSFQLALARLNAKPYFARFLIHQSGPLFDYPEELDGYCDVYINGMREVERLLHGVVARPL